MEKGTYRGKLYSHCMDYVRLMEVRHYLKFNMGFDEQLVSEVEEEILDIEKAIMEVLDGRVQVQD